MPQPDVLGHGQIVKQYGFLVDRGHTGTCSGIGGKKPDVLPVKLDGAGVRLVDAGPHFDEGGFSRTVFADQSGNGSGKQVQLHVLQRLDAGKAFGNAAKRQDGLHLVDLGKEGARRRGLPPGVFDQKIDLNSAMFDLS